MKQTWQKKEKKDAKTLKAHQTPRSGGLWFAKGDSQSETFLIDSKETKHERFSITKKIWEKLEHEAVVNQRLPLLSIKFGNKPFEIVALDINDFATILDELDRLKKGAR